MRVSAAMTFNEYWNDPKFQEKKPNLRSSKKQAFGDNIYHKPPEKPWQQLNSHHSFADGSVNIANVRNDTQSNRVLIGEEFVYWGGGGPRIPAEFRNYNGIDLCAKRGHKRNFPEDLVTIFVNWIKESGEQGFVAPPLDWDKTQ
jgi:Nucleotide modification associated domain 2